MNNFPPVKPQRKKYSAAIIAVIVCAALVAGAVSIAILNPEGALDLLPSLTGDSRSKVHFTDMKYERPDTETLVAQFDTLIAMIERGDSFTEQCTVYNDINEKYTDFMTMYNLVYIHYCKDITDEFYTEELSVLESDAVTIESKLNTLHNAIASSNFKRNYERTYYGVGYFTDWVSTDYSDEVMALMEREVELIEEYRRLMENPSVSFNGREVFIYSDYMNNLSESDYFKVLDRYYDKYNRLAGQIYINMIKTRRSIAEKLGTDYITYAYEGFNRDYTPEMAQKYLDGVIKDIAPLYSQVDFDPSAMYEELDPGAALYAVANGSHNLGNAIDDAFDYMLDYGLYDISAAKNKPFISYTTYLYSYNAPYLFVSPSCTADDFFTLSHEFGHFVDAYRNQTIDSNLDAAEVASQAMEYLMPHYTAALEGYEQEELIKYSLYKALESYMEQSFLSRFEQKVYSLPDNQLTVEAINDIAYECAVEFGLGDYADYYTMTWFEVTHVFEVPFYTISYVISNDTALQILEAELDDPGKGGPVAFLKAITRDSDLSFTEQVVASGFESPFANDRTEKIATVISNILIDEEGDSAEDIKAETLPAA